MKPIYIIILLGLLGLKASAQCEPIALPYSENFENAAVPALPECTSSSALTPNTGPFYTTTVDGNRLLQFNSEAPPVTNPENPFLQAVFNTRVFHLEEGKFYNLSFTYYEPQSGIFGAHILDVQFRNTDGSIAGIAYIASATSTPTTFLSSLITVPQDGNYSLEFALRANPNFGVYNIDNISISEMICAVPQGLAVTAVTATSVSFSWEGANPGSYQYSVMPAGQEPGAAFPTGIPSATRYSLQPETNYTVYVRQRCSISENNINRFYWSDWSEGVNFTTANAPVMGIDDIAKSSLSIYPNPVKDKLNLSYPEVIDTVEIYNSLGQLMLHENINSREASLSLQHLAAGHYFLIAYSGDWFIKVQLMKE